MLVTSTNPAFGSSVDRAYQELRSAIVVGTYPPDSPLRLHELSADLGVSLIPIREALRRLEVERLVESRPNRGARVAAISLADVSDAYDTRVLLETEALRRAWPHLDSPALDRAGGTLEEMFAAFEGGRLSEGAALHERYHFELWARAESDWLDHLVRILWGHTERYRNLALVLHTPAREAGEYHLVTLDALRRGDVEAAVAHTEEELGKARDVVLTHLSETMDEMVPAERPA